ncbi:MAG TPA: shikimate kinase [Porphyromonadaceae bacterium]|nr:shikimate kinase [Porphyromonadaceae bacterium]
MNRGVYFLLGYMGCGKSTWGPLLAKALEVQFIDLDQEIEKHLCTTITCFFHEQGEDAFRKVESMMLRKVSSQEGVLISTGGGTPCFEDNMLYMNKVGKTLYLKVPLEVLHHRLFNQRSERPVLSPLSDKELFSFIQNQVANREVFYNQANLILPHNASMEEWLHLIEEI